MIESTPNDPASSVESPATGKPLEAIIPDAEIARVGNEAFAQHIAAEQPKRGRGRPRKIPLSIVGNGTDPSSGAQNPSLGNQGSGKPVPIFDETAAKAVVNGLLGCVNDLAEAVMRSYAFTHSQDKVFSAEAGKLARMGDKTEELVRIGAIGCWKKYGLAFQYVEETALIGGLVLWLGGISVQFSKIRERCQPAAAAA